MQIATIESLEDESQLRFWEFLAHNLTVAVRAVWSDPEIRAEDKVQQIRWINEFAHRVTSKIHVQRTNQHEWPAREFDSLLDDYSSSCPAVRDHLNAAVAFSFKALKSGHEKHPSR